MNSVQFFSVPTTPDNFNVCAVYDKMNSTLQIIEATWNELVCCIYRLPIFLYLTLAVSTREHLDLLRDQH